MSYLYLALAIVAEVIATSALKASNEFTRLWPSVVVVVGYLAAFYLLSLVLRSVPVGIAYAFWAGLGIVLVTLGGITGTAEKLSIRSVGIRDLHGTYHLVPFSSVDVVSNYMRGFGYHVGEYGVAYRENVDEAIVALRNAFDELSSDEDLKSEILEPLEVAGVIALADSSVNIRVRIKTTPGNQWAVGRAYNRLVKLHLDEAGIEIPFPHTTIFFGEDKQGQAPAANLRLVEKDVVSTGKEKDTAPLPGEEGSVDAPREHETREDAETNAKFKGDYDPDGN